MMVSTTWGEDPQSVDEEMQPVLQIRGRGGTSGEDPEGGAALRGVRGRGWREEGTGPPSTPSLPLYSRERIGPESPGLRAGVSGGEAGYSALNGGDSSRPESPGLYRPESPVQNLRNFR